MKITLFTSLLLVLLMGKAGVSQDYQKVDNTVGNYPKSFSNPQLLANLILRDFEMPEEKARAIFTWIALNIDYDIKALSSAQRSISFTYTSEEEKKAIEKKIKQDIVDNTLRKRKAVCEGYSMLYQNLCELVSLECEVITGSSRTRNSDIGKLPRNSDHAWNAVKINGQWNLLDATWGAGYINGNRFTKVFTDYYFFTPPWQFALNHFPEDTRWLFTEMTPKQFSQLPLYHPGLFQNNIEIPEPYSGFISTGNNKPLRLVVKNCSNQTLSFHFENEKYSRTVAPEYKDGKCVYVVEYDKRTTTFLTVFMQNTALVTYKIN